MHIPDAYLSPETQAAAFAVVAPILIVAARRTRATLETRQMPLLSVGAAFCFAVQMFNIPAIGGTTAHALGTVLLTILLGPWTAILTMTLNLAVQALFFGDGGVLSLGVNAIDMAVIPAFVGHNLYRLIARTAGAGTSRTFGAAALASYAGTSVAALSAGSILGLQPLIAHDGAGRALFFPFGWSISLPAMLGSHLLIAAPAEAIITVSALAYLWRNFPDLTLSTRAVRAGSRLRLGRTVGLVLLLTPIGLIAGGTAWGEWDPDTLKGLIGYVPSGAARSHDLIRPLLPDYALPNAHGALWDVAGYVVSALVGGVLVALVTRSFIRHGAKPLPAAEVRSAPQRVLPVWLTSSEPLLVTTTKSGARPWIESLLLRMRSSIEETVARERVARLPGVLQRMPATVKAVLALAGLVLIALTRRPELLAGSFGAILCLAAASRIPLRAFMGRVLGAALFFGGVVSLPLALNQVTPGRVLIGHGAFALSDAGIVLAATMLVRLCCGIGLTLLWTVTTRWQDLSRSLGVLGLPAAARTGITLAYRYLFVTMDTLEEMATARRSRQFGQIDKRQAREYAGAGSAILFGKSYCFMEEVHMAMRSRCFDREPLVRPRPRLRARTALAAAAGALLLAAIGVMHAI